jgi:hypothetical protein
MNGELIRFAYTKTATLGLMRFGDLQLATIERPWIENPAGPGGMPRQSCVPDGTYTIAPHNTVHFPDTFILSNNVLGVWTDPNLIPSGQPWGRSAILIHVGNVVTDVIGCVAVGEKHVPDRPQVVNSRNSLDKLRAVLGKDLHRLTIRPIAGTQEQTT